MDLFEHLDRHGSAPAVIDHDGAGHSYRKLAALVERFTSALPPGRAVILVRTRNRLEALVGLLGGISAGHVVIPLDAALAPALARRVVEAYRPDYVWDVAPGEGPDATAVHGLGDYRLEPHPSDRLATPHPAVSLVLLTSGSTGSPKGVRLARRGVAANALAIGRYLGLTPADRAITTLPMSYSYGLSVVTSHLHAGGALVLTDESVVRAGFWEAFREHRATSFAGVPMTYELLDAINFPRLDLPSLRYFTQAGGALPGPLRDRFVAEARRRHVRFFVMYGQTEATARISYLRADTAPEPNTGVGTAIPGGRLYAVDSAGRPITEPGVPGDLVYEGPNVMLGYAGGRTDLGRGDELGGRLVTGDIGYFDERGHCHLVGRRSRFVKLSGLRVDLDDVERHLAAEGIVTACAGRRERLLIAVLDGSVTSRVLRSLRAAFRIDRDDVDVVEVGAIPRTASGKVAYGQVFAEMSAADVLEDDRGVVPDAVQCGGREAVRRGSGAVREVAGNPRREDVERSR
jgi:long-chain acyl-CoA synthetase